jgi:hypothetical protein
MALRVLRASAENEHHHRQGGGGVKGSKEELLHLHLTSSPGPLVGRWSEPHMADTDKKIGDTEAFLEGVDQVRERDSFRCVS